MLKFVIECPHCGNTVVYDQTQGDKAKCPVCHEPINTLAEKTKLEEFSCAQCGVRLEVTKGTEKYVCPVCDFENDVAERLLSEKIKRDGLASVIKYEGDNETLVWKHPIEDFNMGSQLIVHERRPYSSGTVRPWTCLARGGTLWRLSSSPSWRGSTSSPRTRRGPSTPRSTT